MAKGAGAFKWTQTVPSKHKRKPNLPTACKSSSKRTLAGLRSSLETPVDDQDITEVLRCCMPLCRLYICTSLQTWTRCMQRALIVSKQRKEFKLFSRKQNSERLPGCIHVQQAVSTNMVPASRININSFIHYLLWSTLVVLEGDIATGKVIVIRCTLERPRIRAANLAYAHTWPIGSSHSPQALSSSLPNVRY